MDDPIYIFDYLKSMVNSLLELINNKETDIKKLNVQTITISTQTEDIFVPLKPTTVSRHTSMNTEYKSIATQIYPKKNDVSIQSNYSDVIKTVPKVDTGHTNYESKTVPNPSSNRPRVNVPLQTANNKGTAKTLIIGSSVLKGIQTKGLTDTHVCTNRGADINRLIEVVESRDISQYKNIVVHIGGNDFSNGDSLRHIRNNYESLLYLIKDKSDTHSVIMLSSVTPRYGLNVSPVNEVIMDLCEQFNLQFIDHGFSFYDKNGKVNNGLYYTDGIHLSKKGTATFLRDINSYVSILKNQNNAGYCYYCGESGHNAIKCRHGQEIQCFSCGCYGHKQKYCSFYC